MQQLRLFNRLVAFLLLLMALSAGCGKSDETLSVYPVRGRVLVRGVGPERAEVRLVPKTPLADPLKRSIEPHSTVQADGSFVVGTYANDDGAPQGEYAVTLTWPAVKIEGGEEILGPDRLGQRYSSPLKPIATVTVETKPNTIPDILLK